ncbi:hypothetical protein [Shewanella woodyi]|uniref:hypothetical protein n=1 Tax=Shewanella woodyi TaxID=60961 RepID=UPI0037480C0E
MNGIKLFITLILSGLCGAFLFSLTLESGDNGVKSHADKQFIVSRSELIKRETTSPVESKEDLREERAIDKANIATLESRLEQMTNEINRLNALVESKSVTIEELTAELEAGLTEYARSLIEKQLEDKIQNELAQHSGVASSKEIKRLINAEPRDEQWAYDVETQLADFVQMSEASGELIVKGVNCRSQSCEFSFTHDDSFVGWDQFRDALYAQEWWSFNNTHILITPNGIEVLATQTAKQQ